MGIVSVTRATFSEPHRSASVYCLLLLDPHYWTVSTGRFFNLACLWGSRTCFQSFRFWVVVVTEDPVESGAGGSGGGLISLASTRKQLSGFHNGPRKKYMSHSSSSATLVSNSQSSHPRSHPKNMNRKRLPFLSFSRKPATPRLLERIYTSLWYPKTEIPLRTTHDGRQPTADVGRQALEDSIWRLADD